MHLVTIEEWQGLKLSAHVEVPDTIAAIVGRNGAGKTRLLQAIMDGKVDAVVDGAAIPRHRIVHLTMDKLQPSLVFGFDPVQHRNDTRHAMAQYAANRGKFHVEPRKSIEAIGGHGMSTLQTRVNIHQVAHIASAASSALGKDINALEEQDIADYFASASVAGLGSLNVTSTMLAYWHRREQNFEHEYRNAKHAADLPYWTPEQFEARFGSPPWDVFNQFLRSVLDGRYQIREPTHQNVATYEARLFRDDGREIDPSSLSSGEKVLMWLCLSMYVSDVGRVTNPPQLLLLDEPDAALHPQMVQKLHEALRLIVRSFGSNILFTTHSPTTVALFEDGPIFQVSEHDLKPLDKDAAISELLVGVDKVSIHYTNRRQVYVESHTDAEIYSTLFNLSRKWGIAGAAHISLAFIPAAPKLSPNSVHQLLKAHLGELDAQRAEAFVLALNGQGNSAQVVGAVESLASEGSTTVHGVIDWDCCNRPQQRVHVLGEGHFYNIESAILNPLTLGLYLLHNYPDKVVAQEYGLGEGFDSLSLYADPSGWQAIADGVTRRVLKIDTVSHDVECHFLRGGSASFDCRYVHGNGHGLEPLLKDSAAYPFLNAITKRPTLVMDVVRRGIQSSQGRSLPMDFSALFTTIQ